MSHQHLRTLGVLEVWSDEGHAMVLLKSAPGSGGASAAAPSAGAGEDGALVACSLRVEGEFSEYDGPVPRTSFVMDGEALVLRSCVPVARVPAEQVRDEVRHTGKTSAQLEEAIKRNVQTVEEAMVSEDDDAMLAVGAMMFERKRLQQELDVVRAKLGTTQTVAFTVETPTTQLTLEPGQMHTVRVDAVFGGEGRKAVALFGEREACLKWSPSVEAVEERVVELVRMEEELEYPSKEVAADAEALERFVQETVSDGGGRGRRRRPGWDPNKCRPGIQIEGNALRKTASGHCVVLGRHAMSSGVHRFRVKAVNAAGIYCAVGVARAEVDLSRGLGLDANSAAFYSNGALYHNGTSQAETSWTTGDVITVIVDFPNRTVSAEKNGEPMGVMWPNLSGTVYPAVLMYSSGDHLELLAD